MMNVHSDWTGHGDEHKVAAVDDVEEYAYKEPSEPSNVGSGIFSVHSPYATR
ncbi:hypothetical protein [Halorubrum sp. FL23]